MLLEFDVSGGLGGYGSWPRHDFQSPNQETAIGKQICDYAREDHAVDQDMSGTQLDRMVAEKIIEPSNTVLDVQANEPTGASRHERSDSRKGVSCESLSAESGSEGRKAGTQGAEVKGHFV